MIDPARLIQARRLAGLTPKGLARKLGTSPQHVGLYEAGVITPDARTLRLLAQVARVTEGFFEAGRPMARLDSSEVHICAQSDGEGER